MIRLFRIAVVLALLAIVAACSPSVSQEVIEDSRAASDSALLDQIILLVDEADGYKLEVTVVNTAAAPSQSSITIEEFDGTISKVLNIMSAESFGEMSATIVPNDHTYQVKLAGRVVREGSATQFLSIDSCAIYGSEVVCRLNVDAGTGEVSY